jgi:threonine dehydratase
MSVPIPQSARGDRNPAEGYLREHAEAIAEAHARIAAHIRRTPLLTTDLDPSLRLKAECFQVTGSFKARGAFNAVLALGDRDPQAPGVITTSSGNHAQAVALAARTAGLPAVVLIPEDATPAKVAATKAYGAEVIQDGVTFSNREERLREVQQERGLAVVHPYDNWDILHGAGTAAREALQDDPTIATVVAPIGGGGLLSGTALAARAHNPAIRVIGVEPEVADDAYRTLESGQVQRLAAAPETMADGVRTMSIGTRNFEVLVAHHLADQIITVSEPEIAGATAAAWLRLKLALEPTGALPLAAWLAGSVPAGPGPTLLLFSGGNANTEVVARLLEGR